MELISRTRSAPLAGAAGNTGGLSESGIEFDVRFGDLSETNKRVRDQDDNPFREPPFSDSFKTARKAVPLRTITDRQTRAAKVNSSFRALNKAFPAFICLTIEIDQGSPDT